jgi:hypothetical protein
VDEADVHPGDAFHASAGDCREQTLLSGLLSRYKPGLFSAFSAKFPEDHAEGITKAPGKNRPKRETEKRQKRLDC